MKEYIREGQAQERRGTLIGVILTVLLHGVGVGVVCTQGLKYLDPPPPETTFLLDFSQDEEVVERIIPRRGSQPRAEEIDRTRPVELVQRSESQYQASNKSNLTTASRQDEFGDIDTPKLDNDDALDPRASFPGMSTKDTSLTAPHSAEEASDQFKAGQPTGNTTKGIADGKPNARLKGRRVVGDGIRRPAYNVQDEGIVVVQIQVDNYGRVVKAVPGYTGTTVNNKSLWAAARSAAMETHFNATNDAPALQEGTITYIFKLN